jgi:two-component system nitrate/nitrite response regulator NarL
MIDLVVCDDHALFADALAAVLSRQGFVVRAVTPSTARVIEVIRAQRPDVVLLDRHLPDGDSIDLVGRLVAACPETKVLIVTADHDPVGARRACLAGAAGYLHKTRGVGSLTSAIRRIMTGEVIVDLPAHVPAQRSPEASAVYRLAGYLTPRERECLELLVEGLGTCAMAHRFGVSVATVRTHVRSVLTKLGVHSRLEAVSLATRHGLCSAGQVPRPAMLGTSDHGQ